jgi:type I restriction enzyme R subunit
VDQNVNAEGVELLTEQVDITNKKKFEEAIESLGSSKSKAEAIAAQTKRSISEKFETDPEFYQRFSDKIDDLLKKMRDGKMSDLEVLKNMKQVKEDVVGKKDITMPKVIALNKGADILFRNLREEFNDEMPVDVFVDIILGMYEVVKKESIVDWHQNMEVKRSIMSKLDDYLYDVVRLQMGVELPQEQAQKIIEKTISLAVNNNDIFKK